MSRRKDPLEIKYERAYQKIVRKRGETIEAITKIESMLDNILTEYFTKPTPYINVMFHQILMLEDFRLSTKVKMFEYVDVPGELKAKQKDIIRTMENKLLPTRNKFAHLQSLLRYRIGGKEVPVLIGRAKAGLKAGNRLYEISDKEFKAFLKECDRIQDLLGQIWTLGVMD